MNYTQKPQWYSLRKANEQLMMTAKVARVRSELHHILGAS